MNIFILLYYCTSTFTGQIEFFLKILTVLSLLVSMKVLRPTNLSYTQAKTNVDDHA